jgi:hypothetical protein
MNFNERYHSNRINYFANNCSQLIEDARRYQSGEKTCRGNRPQPVRELVQKVENYLRADPFETNTAKQIILDLANLPSNPAEWTSHQRCLARHFLKEPTRQNLSENTQHEHLKKRGIQHEKLKADGVGCIRLHEGALLFDKKKGKIKGRRTKSMDGRVGNTLTIQKHTTGNGGHQNNQSDDVEHELILAIEYCRRHNDHWKFALILDGNYWTLKRLDRLNDLIPTEVKSRIRITNSDEF